ncbi:hypothetical protein P3T35_001326 [Kitasatospora sp. GP30]|uniref:hypothetical protein n=1 Tax=Kitasatospora sp. GP30 TaxID=3035084 RepID=UPI000C6FDB29|nr:hypothetical protein [Kitasatospora sp. GP30]MDH6139326.1 hypothetical protein [Kitasatospora sp. GP30]
MLRPLAPTEVIGGDHPVGGYSLTGLLPPAPVPLPSRRALLGGAALVVPPPQGAPIDAPGVPERAAAELGELLGGTFGSGATLPLSVHDALVSPQTRAQYGAPGLSLTWDRPRHGFYWLAARLDDRQVQACGEPGHLHCVSFHRPLAGPPTDDPWELLAQLAPALHARLRGEPAERGGADLRDITAAFSPGLFGIALSAPELRIRTGVRQALRTDGTPAGLVHVLRIDAGPGCREWPGP